MNKKKILSVCIPAALIAAAAIIGAAAAGAEPGGQDDPLVTLSYIKDVFTGEVLDEANRIADSETEAFYAAFGDRLTQVEEQLGDGAELARRSTYQLVVLSDGQRMVCSRGTELMLRIGRAFVSADDIPGLVDTSTAANLNDGGELEENHMYMVTIEGNGIKASGTVKLIARGEWEIK
ncbi:MAG: hypothetical protein K5855_07480 [Oscillospiraceae bacterium]|jgi:hypothetical protein|nr:hypothetical protein [Oscillospiraceae bacterium]